MTPSEIRQQRETRAFNAAVRRAQAALNAGSKLYWRGDDWGVDGTEPVREGIPLGVPESLVAQGRAMITRDTSAACARCVCGPAPVLNGAQTRYRRDLDE
jgi:hypothetical protein